ncbi:hypothetical protein [Christiangramia echinicola]|uniref:hypothetical protein n=1 Tax=Christiangramia echinicola TaxID=279359 RepID=UPI0012EBF058|nr:hypothetical protein [Christiangramia echinicola]
MPLSNNKFTWRPNDNSSLTNLRYNLEATKWVSAVKSAETKLKKPTAKSIKWDLGAVGMFISIPLLLLLFIFLIPLQLIKVVFRYNIKIFPGDPPTGRILTDREKFDKRLAEIKNRHSSKVFQIKPTHEMTQEEIADLVAYVKEETAKSKAITYKTCK